MKFFKLNSHIRVLEMQVRDLAKALVELRIQNATKMENLSKENRQLREALNVAASLISVYEKVNDNWVKQMERGNR